MVNDFDKEIDAMLRDLAKGDSFAQVLPASHLDADEISAFAENALPKMARVRATEHLADCSKCRKILSNTIFLNSAEESETIHEEIKTVVSAPVISWYKKIFVFPNLSYAMGAMALLLVGMVGFLILQKSNNSNSMVAQSEKIAEKSSGPNLGSSEGDYSADSYSANSNASSAANVPLAMATPALNSANSVANNAPISKDSAPASPVVSSNSPTSAPKTDSGLTDKVTDDEAKFSKKGGDAPTDLARKEDAKPVGTPTNEPVTAPNEGGERRDMNKQAEISQNQTNNIQNVSPDSGNVARTRTAPPSPTGPIQEQERDQNVTKPQKKEAQKNRSAEAKSKSVETRKIGSKSFRDVSGIWTDTSYSGGATQNVKRNSDDYKKLDSGLQNTANSLGGTVIIVWGGKNYKIQ